MISLGLLLVVVVALAQVASLYAAQMPASATIWFPHHPFDQVSDSAADGGKGKHVTRTLHAKDVVSKIRQHVKSIDAVVFLDSSSNSISSSSALKTSIAAASNYEVMSNVYASEHGKEVAAELAEQGLFDDAREMSADEFCASERPLKGSYRVSGTLGASCLHGVHSQATDHDQHVAMVAVADSAAVAPRRALSSSSAAATGAVNAGYSIYYDETYLLITPEIFTGLMTGVFLFFVALIGINCLGSIQGPASFVDRNPSVGKEC
jgi:hypothetical protein